MSQRSSVAVAVSIDQMIFTPLFLCEELKTLTQALECANWIFEYTTIVSFHFQLSIRNLFFFLKCII